MHACIFSFIHYFPQPWLEGNHQAGPFYLHPMSNLLYPYLASAHLDGVACLWCGALYGDNDLKVGGEDVSGRHLPQRGCWRDLVQTTIIIQVGIVNSKFN
jgi:hypothetical protein